jgi:hypothetical protein
MGCLSRENGMAKKTAPVGNDSEGRVEEKISTNYILA